MVGELKVLEESYFFQQRGKGNLIDVKTLPKVNLISNLNWTQVKLICTPGLCKCITRRT